MQAARLWWQALQKACEPEQAEALEQLSQLCWEHCSALTKRAEAQGLAVTGMEQQQQELEGTGEEVKSVAVVKPELLVAVALQKQEAELLKVQGA